MRRGRLAAAAAAAAAAAGSERSPCGSTCKRHMLCPSNNTLYLRLTTRRQPLEKAQYSTTRIPSWCRLISHGGKRLHFSGPSVSQHVSQHVCDRLSFSEPSVSQDVSQHVCNWRSSSSVDLSVSTRQRWVYLLKDKRIEKVVRLRERTSSKVMLRVEYRGPHVSSSEIS